MKLAYHDLRTFIFHYGKGGQRELGVCFFPWPLGLEIRLFRPLGYQNRRTYLNLILLSVFFDTPSSS